MSKFSLQYLAYLTRMAFKFAVDNVYHVEPAFSDAAGGTSDDGSIPMRHGQLGEGHILNATANFMVDVTNHKVERAHDNQRAKESLKPSTQLQYT